MKRTTGAAAIVGALMIGVVALMGGFSASAGGSNSCHDITHAEKCWPTTPPTEPTTPPTEPTTPESSEVAVQPPTTPAAPESTAAAAGPVPPAPAAPAQNLPTTGSSSWALVFLALAALGSGAGLVGLSRRQ
jgi:LPXTG-motif cell wall-anchored protein